MLRFTSVIRRVLGNAAATKTPMGSYGSTCRRRPTCPATVKRTWTESRCVSISAHARRWALKLRRVDYRPVLHRPLETTPFFGSYLCGSILTANPGGPMTEVPKWSVKGDWFDTCKCAIPCPCYFAQPPTFGDCEGVLAWHIRDGNYGSVALSGLNVMAL